MKIMLIQNTDGLPVTLAGPFGNWKDAETAQAYWALRGKTRLELIELAP